MSLQSTDQIADLITRIRNAIMVGKTEVSAPTSRLKKAVADGLVRAGYISSTKVEKGAPRDQLKIIINSEAEPAKITHIKKISTSGRRVYVGVDEIPTVRSGRGTTLISTSKGVMTSREAKKARLGGELLIEVY